MPDWLIRAINGNVECFSNSIHPLSMQWHISPSHYSAISYSYRNTSSNARWCMEIWRLRPFLSHRYSYKYNTTTQFHRNTWAAWAKVTVALLLLQSYRISPNEHKMQTKNPLIHWKCLWGFFWDSLYFSHWATYYVLYVSFFNQIQQI